MFLEFLKENIVYLDGGMGTLLQAMGLLPGQRPETWNLTHPEKITQIHCEYYNAGSNVVTANTFGANTLHFSPEELEPIIKAALACAKTAAAQSVTEGPKFVALDVGPLGRLLKPLGDLDFEDAVEIFAQTVRLGAKHGADLVIIETMNDSYETKAALLAVKENSTLPVLVSNAYGQDGKLMTGADPAAMVALLEGMGADALGANCSFGPAQLAPVAEQLLELASVPVLLQPNAGLPQILNGQTQFDVGPEEFAAEVAELVKKGLRIVGGCCGTTPAHIAALVQKTKTLTPLPVTPKNTTLVSSYTHAVTFGDAPVLIGERINPTGKKRLKQALLEGDIPYILGEGLRQQEKGAHILDVNVGLPELDEPQILTRAVCELQAVCDLPLQIDTANVEAMESAMRRYNGKPLVNSVNGKQESMQAIFPLVKKYGGAVIALTLDEEGIPASAEGRVEIARRILKTAESYGISKKDIVFDTLTMTISADNTAALSTLQALRTIRTELGCHTSLGVSNVSFGLPNREAVNSTFFALALENGLSAAILNPDSAEMLKIYYTYKALKGQDPNCAAYIAAAEKFTVATTQAAAPQAAEAAPKGTALQEAILKGLTQSAGALTQSLLATTDPMDIIQNEVLPALNVVGKGFEEKRVYLPQLLMSAEAAKAAFEVVKAAMAGQKSAAQRGPVVLATVQGDIHDIGKNIVKLLLENYGFRVVDLGKDVPPQTVLQTVQERKAPMVGLSALMTTTVPAMEETVALLKAQAPYCRVMVGGAVLTPAYAQKMGADAYAKDAMESVRCAQNLVSD